MSMELIDSKKLIDYFFYGIDDKSITGSTETDKKIIQVIKSQETVKAIPISWLEEKLKHSELSYTVTDAINNVLDLWENEVNE